MAGAKQVVFGKSEEHLRAEKVSPPRSTAAPAIDHSHLPILGGAADVGAELEHCVALFSKRDAHSWTSSPTSTEGPTGLRVLEATVCRLV